VRTVDLAIYADALAGEAAALAARVERERSRLRQAAIERAARDELAPATVARLDDLGLLATRADRAALRDLEAAVAAVEELQSWVERRLAAATAA
jgi:hypothetical protein